MTGRDRQAGDRDMSRQTLAVWEPRSPAEQETWHETRRHMVAGVISLAVSVEDLRELLSAMGLTEWFQERFSHEQEGLIAQWIETRAGRQQAS